MTQQRNPSEDTCTAKACGCATAGQQVSDGDAHGKLVHIPSRGSPGGVHLREMTP